MRIDKGNIVDHKNFLNPKTVLMVIGVIILISINNQPVVADSKKIGNITYSVSKVIREHRREVFTEHKFGERLINAHKEEFEKNDLLDENSELALNLSIYVFRFRHFLMAGIFGFLHTGKDRVYYWADLIDGDNTTRLFRVRATNFHGWLFSPNTSERIDIMTYRAAEEAAIRYEEHHYK